MKARISKVYNKKDRETDYWGIMIQRSKGESYNIPGSKAGKLYVTSDKKEVIREVKKLNKQFRDESN